MLSHHQSQTHKLVRKHSYIYQATQHTLNLQYVSVAFDFYYAKFLKMLIWLCISSVVLKKKKIQL